MKKSLCSCYVQYLRRLSYSSSHFPNLSILAKNYLTLSSSSVPVEYIFSTPPYLQ